MPGYDNQNPVMNRSPINSEVPQRLRARRDNLAAERAHAQKPEERYEVRAPYGQVGPWDALVVERGSEDEAVNRMAIDALSDQLSSLEAHDRDEKDGI